MSATAAATRPRIDTLIPHFEREAGSYLAPTYCRVRRNEFLLQRMLAPEIFDREYSRALDIGCGVGFKCLLLGEVAHEVDGIDLDAPYHGFPGSEPAAVFGQRLLSGIGCAWARLEAVHAYDAFLARHADTYDLIVSDYLVEHVADVAALHAAIHAALRPGGAVVHAVPNTHEALDQFVRLNARPSIREFAKAALGMLRRGTRAQKITGHGLLVPIPHSEFLTDYRRQLDVYRLEHNVFAMIEAGFEITRIVPTREHTYTVVARRARDAR